MSLEELKKSIESKVKGIHVSILADSEIAKRSDWIRTPCLDLNRVLSGDLYRGIPTRTLAAIVGPEHTMKTSFMVLCMVEGQKEGFTPVIIDTEGGVTDEFCLRWGLDPKGVLYVYTPWVDEVKVVLAQLKDSGDEKLIVGIDSAGGLEQIKMYNDSLKGDPKGDQGQLQRKIRTLLKLLLNICITQNSIGIVCGHLYGSPGGLIPMPDQIGGGKAMKLFPNTIISLRRTHIKDKDKNIIGTDITATTLKNRICPPFQQSTISIDYKEGINPYAGLLDLGVEAELIGKSGSWYSYKGERLGQGASKASKALESFPELLNDINDWIKKEGYSTINENIKEAEELIEKEEEIEKPTPPKKKKSVARLNSRKK